jgi:hypothetical protein
MFEDYENHDDENQLNAALALSVKDRFAEELSEDDAEIKAIMAMSLQESIEIIRKNKHENNDDEFDLAINESKRISEFESSVREWESIIGECPLERCRLFIPVSGDAGYLILGKGFFRGKQVSVRAGENCKIRYLSRKEVPSKSACIVIEADTESAANFAHCELTKRVSEVFFDESSSLRRKKFEKLDKKIAPVSIFTYYVLLTTN